MTWRPLWRRIDWANIREAGLILLLSFVFAGCAVATVYFGMVGPAEAKARSFEALQAEVQALQNELDGIREANARAEAHNARLTSKLQELLQIHPQIPPLARGRPGEFR